LETFPGPKFFVKYEDLDSDPYNTFLQKVLAPLDIDVHNPVIQQRLRCAIQFARDNEETHRKHSYTFEFEDNDHDAAKEIAGGMAARLGYTDL